MHPLSSFESAEVNLINGVIGGVTARASLSYPARVPDEGSIPSGVGMTAVGVAYIRAQESLRPDRLFDDPLASVFVAASGWTRPTEMLGDPADTSDNVRAFWGTIVAYVIVRTRFLDEYAKDAW